MRGARPKNGKWGSPLSSSHNQLGSSEVRRGISDRTWRISPNCGGASAKRPWVWGFFSSQPGWQRKGTAPSFIASSAALKIFCTKMHVLNGRIELNEKVTLPEGAPVEVSLRASAMDNQAEEDIPTLRERLKSVIGIVEDLPPDASHNVDHYLYGQGPPAHRKRR